MEKFRKERQGRIGNITFTMIKPEAVAANNIGGILNMIEEGGFRIVAMKKVQLSAERSGEFYAVHNERPFYGELVNYMSGGPIIAAILEKDNANKGLCHLTAKENIDMFSNSYSDHTFIFIGLNSLSKSEEYIINYILL